MGNELFLTVKAQLDEIDKSLTPEQIEEAEIEAVPYIDPNF